MFDCKLNSSGYCFTDLPKIFKIIAQNYNGSTKITQLNFFGLVQKEVKLCTSLYYWFEIFIKHSKL